MGLSGHYSMLRVKGKEWEQEKNKLLFGTLDG